MYGSVPIFVVYKFNIMKTTYKYGLIAITALAINLLIGVMVDYFFGMKIYQWLIFGSLVPLTMIKYNKTPNKQ